jgi:hypothetical protein
MSLSEAQVREAQDRLAQVAPLSLDVFHESLAALPAELSDEQLKLWLDEGLAVGAAAPSSSDSISEYFRVAGSVLGRLDEASFRAWTDAGRYLAAMSPSIATAYFHASPESLPYLAAAQLREWAEVGGRLHRATWKSVALASELFASSPVILRYLTVPELARFGRVP